jgi:hypothetical protein
MNSQNENDYQLGINPSKPQKVADDGIFTGTLIVSGIQFVDMTIFLCV